MYVVVQTAKKLKANDCWNVKCFDCVYKFLASQQKINKTRVIWGFLPLSANSDSAAVKYLNFCRFSSVI